MNSVEKSIDNLHQFENDVGQPTKLDAFRRLMSMRTVLSLAALGISLGASSDAQAKNSTPNELEYAPPLTLKQSKKETILVVFANKLFENCEGINCIIKDLKSVQTPEEFVENMDKISTKILNDRNFITEPGDRSEIIRAFNAAVHRVWPEEGGLNRKNPYLPPLIQAWYRVDALLPGEADGFDFEDEKSESAMRYIPESLDLNGLSEYVSENADVVFSLSTNHPQFEDIGHNFGKKIVKITLNIDETEFDATPYPNLNYLDLNGHIKKLKLSKPVYAIDFRETQFFSPTQIDGVQYLSQRQQSDILLNLFDLVIDYEPHKVTHNQYAKDFFEGKYDWTGFMFEEILRQKLVRFKEKVSPYFFEAIIKYKSISLETINKAAKQVSNFISGTTSWEFYAILRSFIDNTELDVSTRQTLLLQLADYSKENTDNTFTREYHRIMQTNPDLINDDILKTYSKEWQYALREHSKRCLEKEHGLKMTHVQEAPKRHLENIHLVVHPLYFLMQKATQISQGFGGIDYSELNDPKLVRKIIEHSIIGWFNRASNNLSSKDSDYQNLGAEQTFIAIDLFEEWQFLNNLPQDKTIVFVLPKGVPLNWEFPKEDFSERYTDNADDGRSKFLFCKNTVAILEALGLNSPKSSMYYLETKTTWSGPLFPQDSKLLNENAKSIALAGGYVNRCVEQTAGDLDSTKITIDSQNVTSPEYDEDDEGIPENIKKLSKELPRPHFNNMEDIRNWYEQPDVQALVQRYHVWHEQEFADVLFGQYD